MDITFHILDGQILKSLLRRAKKAGVLLASKLGVHTTPPRAYNFRA